MKIAVLGAGAVGSYYGALLARAGNEVVLIGRAAHVDAVRRDGLRLETAAGCARVALAASTQASDVAGAELVLFCVKSGDSDSAAAQIAPFLAAGARLVCLQNGVDNARRVRALVDREVIAAVVYVAVELAGAGHVRHHGRGELVLGDSPASAALVELFAGAGVPASVSDNVVGELWAKLVVNCAYNALSAITRLPYAQLVASPGIEATMHDVVDECLAVAQGEGVRVAGDVRAAVWRIAQTMPGQLSSTAQDLMRGKRSEIDALNGHIVRRGAVLGIATPVNGALWALVKAIEPRQ